MWPEGNILVNWHLIFAPEMVTDYVVAHELAHLRYRSHAGEFSAFLATIAPKFGSAKAWLDQHSGSLSADFLVVTGKS